MLNAFKNSKVETGIKRFFFFLMWGILYSFILYIFSYRVLSVLVLGCVISFKFGSTILFSFLFLFLFFIIIIRSAPFPYDFYFLMSAPFPYDSYFLVLLFPYMYHISSKKNWKFRGHLPPPSFALDLWVSLHFSILFMSPLYYSAYFLISFLRFQQKVISFN